MATTLRPAPDAAPKVTAFAVVSVGALVAALAAVAVTAFTPWAESLPTTATGQHRAAAASPVAAELPSVVEIRTPESALEERSPVAPAPDPTASSKTETPAVGNADATPPAPTAKPGPQRNEGAVAHPSRHNAARVATEEAARAAAAKPRHRASSSPAADPAPEGTSDEELRALVREQLDTSLR